VTVCSIHVIGEQMDEEMEQKMSELTIEQKMSGLTIEQKTSNMNKLNENSHEPMTCWPTIEFCEFIRCHHCIKIGKLILNYNWTSPSTYGNYMAGRRNL